MSTEAIGIAARSPSPASVRMRRHRERHRKGIRQFHVRLHVTQIDMLVAKGYLEHKERDDAAALQRAIDTFIGDAFWTLERDA